MPIRNGFSCFVVNLGNGLHLDQRNSQSAPIPGCFDKHFMLALTFGSHANDFNFISFAQG